MEKDCRSNPCQRFGSSLNAHTHIHVCAIDGVFSQDPDATLRFHRAIALSDSDITAVEATTRARVLRLFEREGLLSGEAAEQMRAWDHSGGFSLDASVCVSARDRAGLERLLRYCARPAFASQRLVWENEGKELLYRLPKPRPDGQTVLRLTPLEFIERLAALIPPPRRHRHRHRYHGVLAPNSPLRAAVSARAGKPISAPNEPTDTRPSPPGARHTTPPAVALRPTSGRSCWPESTSVSL